MTYADTLFTPIVNQEEAPAEEETPAEAPAEESGEQGGEETPSEA